MQGTRILLLEDDLIIGEQIGFALRANQLELDWMQSFEEFEKIDIQDYGLAIFDVNIQNRCSIELYEQLVEKKQSIPTIFLSANGTTENVVKALKLGANDFIHKPINNLELLLRVKTHLRLLNIENQQNGHHFQGIKIDEKQSLLRYQDIVLSLGDRQKEILIYLFQNPYQIIKREDFFEKLSQNGEIDSRTVDSHISQIRRRLRQKGIRHISIESVYKVGYRLTNNED